MKTDQILFHKVNWFLRENNTLKLTESWEEQIIKNINSGYLQGEFEIEINNEMDSLIWKITQNK